MRILIAHNRYLLSGGEDAVVAAEATLLRERRHLIDLYERNNAEIAALGRLTLAHETLWSMQSYRDFVDRIEVARPDLIHIHNMFPLISPSVYWAAAKLAIPVVQTLHNFRLLCPQAMFLRAGAVCEDCLGHLPWRAVVRRCYRDSLGASTVSATMLTLHRALGSYRRPVTRYIALSRYAREKFIAGGLPEERIRIKPNFTNVPKPSEKGREGGLFVGRLSPEKGIQVMAGALDGVPGLSITVLGEGPESARLAEHSAFSMHGWRDAAYVRNAMRRASYLVFPSVCAENFPLTLLEAFANGLPVIASDFGGMAEIIDHGRTGLLFPMGSAIGLREQLLWAEAHPNKMVEMGRQARAEYERLYTPEENYRQLMDIYQDAINEVRGRGH